MQSLLSGKHCDGNCWTTMSCLNTEWHEIFSQNGFKGEHQEWLEDKEIWSTVETGRTADADAQKKEHSNVFTVLKAVTIRKESVLHLQDVWVK